jgi:hypothetical protein
MFAGLHRAVLHRVGSGFGIGDSPAADVSRDGGWKRDCMRCAHGATTLRVCGRSRGLIDIVSSMAPRSGAGSLQQPISFNKRIPSTTRLFEQPANFNSRLASALTCFNSRVVCRACYSRSLLFEKPAHFNSRSNHGHT